MSMDTKKFQGTGIALITPFYANGNIDFKALHNLIEDVIKNGIDYFLLLGSTSEVATLSKKEQWAVVEFCMAKIKKRVPVIVGMTSNNTRQLKQDIQDFNFEGIDALLSAAPFYNKPSQEGIYEHFSEIATTSPVPLILYNVPGRTCSNIHSDTVLRLSHEFDNIIGIKESSGNMNQVSRIIQNKPEDFRVISGDDYLTLPLMAMGADGVISVSSNAFPQALSSLSHYCLQGDFDNARKLHYKLIDAMNLFFVEGNPAGVKAGLSAKNMIDNNLRLPLTPVSNETYEKISLRF